MKGVILSRDFLLRGRSSSLPRSLARVHERAHVGERGDERVEHSVRELENELLRASERRGLGAGEVGEPVDKVEVDVGDVLLV